MSENKIEVGDTVTISFFPTTQHNGSIISETITGEVLHSPQDVGDGWRIKAKDGTLYYFLLYALIVKH